MPEQIPGFEGMEVLSDAAERAIRESQLAGTPVIEDESLDDILVEEPIEEMPIVENFPNESVVEDISIAENVPNEPVVEDFSWMWDDDHLFDNTVEDPKEPVVEDIPIVENAPTSESEEQAPFVDSYQEGYVSFFPKFKDSIYENDLADRETISDKLIAMMDVYLEENDFEFGLLKSDQNYFFDNSSFVGALQPVKGRFNRYFNRFMEKAGEGMNAYLNELIDADVLAREPDMPSNAFDVPTHEVGAGDYYSVYNDYRLLFEDPYYDKYSQSVKNGIYDTLFLTQVGLQPKMKQVERPTGFYKRQLAYAELAGLDGEAKENFMREQFQYYYSTKVRQNMGLNGIVPYPGDNILSSNLGAYAELDKSVYQFDERTGRLAYAKKPAQFALRAPGLFNRYMREQIQEKGLKAKEISELSESVRLNIWNQFLIEKEKEFNVQAVQTKQELENNSKKMKADMSLIERFRETKLGKFFSGKKGREDVVNTKPVPSESEVLAAAKKRAEDLRETVHYTKEQLDEILKNGIFVPENAKPDKAKSDKEKPDKAKSDKEKPDKVKSDKAKPDKVKSDKAKPDKEKSDKAKPDKAKSDNAKPDKEKSDKAKSDNAKPENAKPDNAKPENAKPLFRGDDITAFVNDELSRLDLPKEKEKPLVEDPKDIRSQLPTDPEVLKDMYLGLLEKAENVVNINRELDPTWVSLEQNLEETINKRAQRLQELNLILNHDKYAKDSNGIPSNTIYNMMDDVVGAKALEFEERLKDKIKTVDPTQSRELLCVVPTHDGECIDGYISDADVKRLEAGGKRVIKVDVDLFNLNESEKQQLDHCIDLVKPIRAEVDGLEQLNAMDRNNLSKVREDAKQKEAAEERKRSDELASQFMIKDDGKLAYQNPFLKPDAEMIQRVQTKPEYQLQPRNLNNLSTEVSSKTDLSGGRTR